jgi:DNA primase
MTTDLTERRRIYAHLVENSPLLEVHEKELQERRGFTKETISKYRFFSAGDYMLSVEKILLETFTQESLHDCGVFCKGSISSQLVQDNIIIPYFDSEGVFYLRPHKFGLEGQGVEIFQPLNLEDNPREIILTEGEFKSIAAQQLGFKTIAVPGTSSFSREHFPRLLELLSKHKVKKIYVVFDNEIKSDPNLPKYKENPLDRYDTQFYSYLMAKKLNHEGYDTRVCWLPDSWRVDGKIDLDGAVAMGKTYGDILQVLRSGKPHDVYLRECDDECKTILLKKNAKNRLKSHVYKNFNKYYAVRQGKNFEYSEEISNFTLKIVATHHTPEGIIRELQFINEFGEKSKSLNITADQMPSSDRFSTFCLSHGNFIWRGNRQDLNAIWESEFLTADGRVIIESDHIGWVDEKKAWLFSDVMIMEDGKELRPGDRSGVFWIGDEGLRPLPLVVTHGRNQVADGIPALSMREWDVQEFLTRLKSAIGKNEAYLCIGWVTAVLFLEEIFDEYGCFPFLFITGKRGSGKTTVAEWLMNFFGLENSGKIATDTTANAIQRYMAYYSSLPVWVDEYRNTRSVQIKDGFFRNCYNRQSAGKGIKSNFGAREGKIRGTLMFSGEEKPRDNALSSRCIEVYINQSHRTDNPRKWMKENRGRFSNYVYQVLKRKSGLVERFMDALKAELQEFEKRFADHRTCLKYAIISAAVNVVLGVTDCDFGDWIENEISESMQENEESHILAEFLDEIEYMSVDNPNMMKRYVLYDAVDRKIYVYYKSLYILWQEHRRRIGADVFDRNAIMKYMKEHESFLEGNRRHWFPEPLAKRVRCMVFNYETTFEQLRTIVKDGDDEN